MQMPDGKGGFKEMEGDLLPGGAADKEKQDAAAIAAAATEAHDHMVRILKFEQMCAKESNLTPQQRAFSALLTVIAMREMNFPGGPEAFDEINKAAYAYYTENG